QVIDCTVRISAQQRRLDCARLNLAVMHPSFRLWENYHGDQEVFREKEVWPVSEAARRGPQECNEAGSETWREARRSAERRLGQAQGRDTPRGEEEGQAACQTRPPVSGGPRQARHARGGPAGDWRRDDGC